MMEQLLLEMEESYMLQHITKLLENLLIINMDQDIELD